MDEFWGRPASEWTAIGTIVVAAATIIYIAVTAYLARQARSSARSAAASAKAAQDAAEATRRTAVVAEAALDRTFRVTYTSVSSGDSFLHLHAAGSVLHVHGLVLRGGLFTEAGKDSPVRFYAERRVVEVKDSSEQGELPRLLHPGEVIAFKWPFEVVDPKREFFLVCAVRYSIERDGEVRQVMVEAENRTPKPRGGATFF